MAKTKSEVSFSMEQKALLEEAAKKDKPTQFIETGNVGFDLALTDGKGLPMGDSILLWARPGCGKTTVVVDVCKRLIKKHKEIGEPFKVLYIAIENSRGLMSALGMDEYIESGDFIYVARGLCWRQVETFYEAALGGYGPYEGVRLIVIDSINNVLSDQNVKNSCADGDFGTKARERSGFYSKYLPRCKEKEISSIFISQVRRKQQATSFEDPNKAAVSDPDLHNVDIILKCTASTNNTDASKVEEETIFGKDKKALKYIFKMDSKATDCKNRHVQGNCVELLFEKGKCVWNYYVIGKLLEGHKLVKSYTGGWWSFSPEICEAFGLPEGKLRRAEFNKIAQEHAGDFVALLKKMGKYKVGISETEVPADEEEVEETEE